MHIVLNLPFQIDMKKFLEECEKNSLKIYSLKEYFLDEKQSNSSLLLGYASLDNEQIKNGIYLLIKLIEKYMNSK
ncbi:hypothetical protein [Fusobacterium sp.]|uniref:hypothetical protein n=1 Tax=Fusobacterium sp. TaxID=68766 RepID=UPI0025BBC760|nr:hypothetical protein [Fusobacterium sp.]MCI5725604.1 hypothetical protein [Fusobacterium sp.]